MILSQEARTVETEVCRVHLTHTPLLDCCRWIMINRPSSESYYDHDSEQVNLLGMD